ncbi:MAG TPA: hypothetical protein VMV20_01655 [Chitinophagaceae bacterium]|nr:hypothetical protein [Chitinophagaceae bacterium]
MRRKLPLIALPALTLWVCLLASSARAQINVVTEHYDLNRTGANLQEHLLNTTTVESTNNSFGKLWTDTVSGQVYAQPLVVSGLTIPGFSGKKNVLFIATMHDTLYAFNADSAGLFWKKGLGKYVSDPEGMVYNGYLDITEAIGICSTPVIDTLTNTIYVESKSYSAGVYTDTLYALSLTDGSPKFGGEVAISGSVPGTANGDSGTVDFVSARENQRPALALSQGVVYLCFSSYGDKDDYQGWILGYNASDISDQVVVFNTDPNGNEAGGGGRSGKYSRAGIWMSGQGPAVDPAGNLYVITGNGVFDSTLHHDFGDCILKLTPDTAGKTLDVSDWFSPHDQSSLDSNDFDLGSDGPLLIPGTQYLTASCKKGLLYLVNEDGMGHFHSGGDQVAQEFNAFGTNHEVHGSAVYWADNPSNPNTALTYWWSQSDYLSAYRITNHVFNTTPTKGPSDPNGDGQPGGILCLSAAGNSAGSAILWATIPISEDPSSKIVEGYLFAFDASNVGTQLWNSQLDAGRDSVGGFAKFCPPMVANGKVYVPTFSNEVQVYGLFASYVTPVNLVTFNATRLDSAAKLDWTTGSEHNNDHFDVERSGNASDFIKIGSVLGAGNSQEENDYTFLDLHPQPGVNFYRLRQVDFDGKATYSRVVSVDFGGGVENDFKIFPNPANRFFRIQLGGWNPSRIHLRMVSMRGEVVYDQDLTGENLKDNWITVPRTPIMGDGVYLVYLTDPSGTSRVGKVELVP